MTESQDMHVPSPEFVAALELELVSEMRAAAPVRRGWLRLGRPLARHERIAATILLAIGLTVGAGSQIAVAQVQGAQQRTALERDKVMERDLLAMRLQVAREERDKVAAALQAGSASRQSLLESDVEVRRREFAVAKAELDLAEIRATSAAPRTELWAPKVGERDFVHERLRLDAGARQEELRLAEAELNSRREAERAGSEPMRAVLEEEKMRQEAESEFQRAALQLRLRERFLSERLTPAQVATQSQDDQLRIDLMRVRKLVEIASQRLRAAQERFATGAGLQIEVKRAELEVLERRAELERVEREAMARLKPE